MNFLNKISGVLAVVAVVIAIIFSGAGGVALGGVTNYDQLGLTELKVGTDCNDSNSYSSCTGTTIDADGVTVAADFYTVGGIDYASVQQSLTATSSVVCDISDPWEGATSSIMTAALQVSASGLGSAQTFDIATSSDGYATTTPSLASRVSAPLVAFTKFWQPGATTTATVLGFDGSAAHTGESPFFLSPNEHLIFKIATATPRTFSTYLTGTCSATFMKP